jgi:exodeoxyribonuclease-1
MRPNGRFLLSWVMLVSMANSGSSFFFYDLETSGISPRTSRIMQFAGQRTDMDLKPVGEPFNILIKLTPDILPEPDAILLTGITPQQVNADGITEAEFLKIFESEINTPGTIFTGFNSVRFDDEFMRFLRYRNFYDAYDWQWKDERSKWDLLDLTRMTRALRPDGIKWPFASNGEPTCRLELITALNGLDHEHAHDALNDVLASIALAKLIHDHQPKLFDFVLGMRDKKKVQAVVNAGEPFVYTSGKYSNSCNKTTVVTKVADHPDGQSALVYDLHFDPGEYVNLTPKELVKIWRWQKDPGAKRLPVKTLKFNRCPAVAPLGVMDEASQERIDLDQKTWEANAKKLAAAKDFPGKLLEALKLMDKQRQMELMSHEQEVDSQLYDGFFDDHDCGLLGNVRAAEPAQLDTFASQLHDNRLKALLPLYKARNYPDSLNTDERAEWDKFCAQRLFAGGQDSRLAKYFARLQECAALPQYAKKQFLIEELKLYGESIMPAEIG